jgi:uncharacterized membrane protein YeaQ/YmgE (transglycosylase-associated protein family)
MARTVGDVALLLAAIAGDDTADPLACPGLQERTRPAFFPLAPCDLSRLRVAFTPDFGFAPTEAHIRRVFAARMADLQGLFAVLEEATPDCSGTDTAFEVLRGVSFLAAHLADWRERPDLLGPNVRANVEQALGYSGTDIAHAEARQTAIVSALGLVGAFVGVLLVDRWGRRPLIIFSFAGLTLSLLVLAFEPSPVFAVLVVLFGLATLFANMGPGVLDFVYPTEIFPAGLRASATGFGTAISRVGAILAIIVFPGIVQSWGLQRALWLFVAASVVGLVICLFLAPETNGRSLEDISGEVSIGQD